MPQQDDLQNNPLVNPRALPHGAFDFDGVKTEDYMPAIQWAIEKTRAELAAIKNNPDAPTFENTIEADENSGQDFSRIMGILNTVTSNCSTPKIRKVEVEADELTTKFGNEISYDEVLFARIKTIYDARSSLNLDSDQTRLLENKYKSYVRRGILLDTQKKQRLQAINLRLAELSTLFGQNDLESTDAYEKLIDNEADLDGVPERAKNDYKELANEKGHAGKWLIKLEPSPDDIFTHCKNAALREEVARAASAVAESGKHDNKPVVLEIVKLRGEKAQLLGFPTYAEFVLSDRMAGSAATVNEFLKKSLAAYKPAALEYVQKVKDFALQKDGVTDMPSWDYAYYNRWYQEETFQFQQEALRPYFSTEKVLEGLRQHAEKLFNIELRPADGKYSTWHKDVKSYEVYDKKDGRLLAIFLADYYARSGAKHGGAWMNDLRSTSEANGQRVIPIITNACNFAPPANDKPSLLSMHDVETVFHEFGHALHAILAEGKYASLNGVNVKWDFVELPSQIQENWVHEKAVLDGFARNYQAPHELLPDALFQKSRDAAKPGVIVRGMRLTSMSMLDMKWYDSDPATLTSVEAVEKEINDLTRMFNRTAGGNRSTTLSHIFAGGYAAGLYSYKWAEVLDADAFEEFKRRGLYDRATADRLRDLYSKGGRVDPMDLFVAMMGRKPDPNALFRREGVTPPAP